MKLLRKYATSSLSDNVYHELKARGMIAQLTSQRLRNVLESRKIGLYAGVDPSAASLHVGNLAVLMTMLHFHLHGHRVISLIGGATGRVGDPGGRTTEREVMALEKLESNAAAITGQVERFFHTASLHSRRTRYREGPAASAPPTSPTILNNLSWHSSLSLLSFLRFPGKLLRVNALLTRDSVKSRLGSSHGISFAEFSYQLLQAYDFWVLHKEHGVELQVGGSDQWGNIVSGVELIRRESSNTTSPSSFPPSLPSTDTPSSTPPPPFETERETTSEAEDTVYGLTIPLLLTSTGEKFGKSAGNAIWLDAKMTSVFDFYQFFLRVPDADVLPYLRYLTLLPVNEIEVLYAEHSRLPEKRLAQRRLADEVTELIHGAEALHGARLASSVLFDTFNYLGSSTEPESGNSTGGGGTRAEYLLRAIGDHPRLRKVSRDDILGTLVTRVAATHGLAGSHGKAKALAQAGGLYLDNRRIASLDRTLRIDDFMDGRVAILRAGREHLILELL